MTWIVFLFALEIGLVPQGMFLLYDREPAEYTYTGSEQLPTIEDLDFSYSIYTDFQFEAIILDYIFIGGGIRCTMLPTNNYTWDPHSLTYNFSFGGRLGPVELFWHHYCTHPQMTYMYDYYPLDGWEGVYDEIGLKIEGKLQGVK